MKIKSSIILSLVATAGVFCSCNENEQFEGELYEKVIYLLSNDDYTFESVHEFGDISTGYVTAYCGGTEHLQKDVTVELEPDPEALAAYNRMYFDINESKYALELDPAHYTIGSYTTVLRADSPDNYALLPIEINPEGLSPDKTYIIPLRIKSISDYRTNPDKEKVLFRVVLANEYATMKTTTYYQMTGTETIGQGSSAASSGVSVTRVVAPVSKNEIRLWAGTNSYSPGNVTDEEMNRNSIVYTFNEDHTITVRPYVSEEEGGIKVEQIEIDNPEYNFWEVMPNGSLKIGVAYRYNDVTKGNVTMKETNVYRNFKPLY